MNHEDAQAPLHTQLWWATYYDVLRELKPSPDAARAAERIATEKANKEHGSR